MSNENEPLEARGQQIPAETVGEENVAPSEAADHAKAEQTPQPGAKRVSLDKPGDAPEETEHPAPALEAPDLGRFNACFNGLSRIGPLVLLAALACMAWPIFWEPAKGVFCPAEIKPLTAFLHCLAEQSWLAPTGLDNGAWSAAQWPAFTWAAGLLALSPGLVESGYLLPATSFLCTFFAVLGVWCLAHAAGFGYRAAFASGLILLCAPLFAPLPHFAGPAALAAGLLLFALVFFCRGWKARASWFSLPIAFALTALAGMAGGLLHFIVPLLASFCYLIWRGGLRRAQKADAICGFILMLAIIGCWLGSVMLYHANDPYLTLLFEHAWQWGWPIPVKWLLPLAAGLLGTMPWLLMIFGVSWIRVLTNAGRTLSASRHENGSALVWISITLALACAIFVPWFHPAAVAIACLAAVLLGKAATALSNAGSRFFYLLASICLIIAGCVLLCVSFEPTQHFLFSFLPQLPVPDLGARLLSLDTLPIIGAIVAIGGIIALMFVKRFSGCGPLIYAILLVIVICQPARLKLVPELAAMPASPLVPFSTIETQVNQALAQPSQPQTPAAPLPEATAPAPHAPENANPALPASSAPEVPQSGLSAPEPAQPEAPQINGSAPELIQPEAPESSAPEAVQPEPAPAPQNESGNQPAGEAPEQAPAEAAPEPAPAEPVPGQNPEAG